MTSSRNFPSSPGGLPDAPPRFWRDLGLWIPLAVLFLLSLIINWFDLDRQIASLLYLSEAGWKYRNEAWVQFFYHFGTWLAIAVAVVALIVLLLSSLLVTLRRHNRLALFLLLLLLLGPGLIVNTLFKNNFGRPRPTNVVEYGGTQTFAPALFPNFGEKGHSFPSGHASTGYYWIGLFVYWMKSHRRRSLLCMTVGMIHGSVMGAGRMLQGGHWLSDVIWAAGLVYLTAFFLYQFKWFQPQTDLQQKGIK